MTQQTQSPTRRRNTTVAEAHTAPNRRASSRATKRTSSTDKHGALPDNAALREMIAVAAYFRAEQRGFAPGDAIADWVQAESEIAQKYSR